MNAKEFEEVFERVIKGSRLTLIEKAREYASDEDRLHNFNKAAAFLDVTPQEALWGFLTKHLISLSDMVTNFDTNYPQEVWDEKIVDSINYLILLRAIVEE